MPARPPLAPAPPPRDVDLSTSVSGVYHDADHGLSHEERCEVTAELLERADACDDTDRRAALLDQVVVLNVRIAQAVAARYRDRGVALGDLEQAACEGLVKAVQRFDPARHQDLLTYAVPTIRGEVLRYFRDSSWSVRPPRRVQELQWHINRATDDLGRDLGREPTPLEVCRHVGISRADHDEAVGAFGCFSPSSLDQPVGGTDGLTVGGSLADEHDTEQAVEARVMLAPVLRRLSERDRRILHLRFVEDQTQQQIGEEFDVPQMQVSRWLTRIFAGLRDDLAD